MGPPESPKGWGRRDLGGGANRAERCLTPFAHFMSQMSHNQVDSVRNGCYRCDMGDLNIRNVPEELMKRFKMEAARCGVSLREWVLQKLMDDSHHASPASDPISVADRVVAKIGKRVDITPSSPPLEHMPNCRCFLCKPPK